MAYTPNRGCVSTNLITFTFCDITLAETKKPVGQYFADLIKAFNSSNRTTMLKLVQKICGAGELCLSRFTDRTYIYNGERRGQDYNKGVDPGAPISVFLFKLFVTSDKDD